MTTKSIEDVPRMLATAIRLQVLMVPMVIKTVEAGLADSEGSKYVVGTMEWVTKLLASITKHYEYDWPVVEEMLTTELTRIKAEHLDLDELTDRSLDLALDLTSQLGYLARTNEEEMSNLNQIAITLDENAQAQTQVFRQTLFDAIATQKENLKFRSLVSQLIPEDDDD